MKKVCGTVGVLLFALCVQATPYVTNVVAKQRYPWNEKVDITYETYGFGKAKSKTIFSKLVAKDLRTGITYVATNNLSSLSYSDGKHSTVWDMAECGAVFGGIDTEQMSFSICFQSCPRYCIIDVSSGPTANQYPVFYSEDIPSGGWDNSYKTDKIVLRCVEPGHRLYFPYLTEASDRDRRINNNNSYWDVWLTDPYYIGVFEVTQKQFELVMGESPKGNGGSGIAKPQECVSYEVIRGKRSEYPWSSGQVKSESFLGRLRQKTGLCFDLPTSWQWENACTAGVEADFNNGGSSKSDMQIVGRYAEDPSHPSSMVVGKYAANRLGLYDMHGNVAEIILDKEGMPPNIYKEYLDVESPNWPFPSGMSVFDPEVTLKSDISYCFTRGGGYTSAWGLCTAWSSGLVEYNQASSAVGFRLCWTVK